MEEFIQIIIFVGAMAIAVIGQSAKNKKKSTTTSPQEVLEDMFPNIEVLEEEKVKPQPQQSVSFPKKTSVRKQEKAQPHSPEQQKETPKQGKKINLNHKTEAKRAFIYSEIFNRKY